MPRQPGHRDRWDVLRSGLMDFQATLDLLRRDVMATVDARAHDEVLAYAEEQLEVIATWATSDRLVDEVQQMIHDSHIDTTRPQCSMHPNHPLWCTDGVWRCPKGADVAIRLGGLSESAPLIPFRTPSR